MAVVTAPWLIPTDVVRSASAGANVGLQARAADLRAAAQRQAASEFAAKLTQQAYQFSAEQDAAAARLAIAQDQHAAKLATELRQQDALDAYRQGELKVRQQNAETNASRLLRANFEPRVVDVGGKALWQVEPNRYMFPPSEREDKIPGLTPDVKQALVVGNADLAVMRRDISDQKKAIAKESNKKKQIDLKASLLDSMMESERAKDSLLRMTTNRPAANSLQMSPVAPQKLTVEKARELLIEAGGDKEKARALARERGFDF